MSLIYFRNTDEISDEPVSDGHPLPVAVMATPRDAKRITVSVQLDASASPAYTAGDAVGSWFLIPNAARFGDGGGYIDTVEFSEDTVQAASATLFLFNRQIAGSADNAAFAPTDAEMRTCVGRVDITSYPATAPGSNQMAQALNGPGYNCTGGSTSLWAQLQTNGTPTYAVNGVTLKIVLVRD